MIFWLVRDLMDDGNIEKCTMFVMVFSERDLGAELVAPKPVKQTWNGHLEDYLDR